MVKKEIAIVLASFLLALTLVGMIQFGQFELNTTGFATHSSQTNEQNSTENQDSKNHTEESALASIQESNQILEEMKSKGYPYQKINDTLIEANQTFRQAQYAEILRNDSGLPRKRSEAREALRLINWREINYTNVIELTNEIKQRRDEIILLSDKIDVTNQRIQSTEINTSQPKELLKQANNSFNEGRLNQTSRHIRQSRESLEQQQLEQSTYQTLKKSTENFIVQNWKILSAGLLALIIIAFIAYKTIKIKLVSNKIKKMKAKKTSIKKMIKELQKNRYNKGNISEIVYNLREKEYKKGLNELERKIPVQEKYLKKLKKKWLKI